MADAMQRGDGEVTSPTDGSNEVSASASPHSPAQHGRPDWHGPDWDVAAHAVRTVAGHGRAGAKAGVGHTLGATALFAHAVAVSWSLYRRNVWAFVIPFGAFVALYLLLLAVGAFGPMLATVREIYIFVVSTDGDAGTPGLSLVLRILLFLAITPLLMIPALFMAGGQINLAGRLAVGEEKVGVRRGFWARPSVLLMLAVITLMVNLLGLLGVFPGLVALFLLLYALPAVCNRAGFFHAFTVSVLLAVRNPLATFLILVSIVAALAASALLLFLPLVVVLPMLWLTVTGIYRMAGGPQM